MRNEANALSLKTCNQKNSITKGEGSFSRALGEIAARDFLNRSYGSGAIIAEHHDYDILTDAGITIEVKSKRCNTPPKPHYDCTVSMFNTKQKCDYYLFTRVSKSVVYLLGFISRSEFMQRSRKMKKGQQENDVVNGQPFQFHARCLNIEIYKLRKLKPKKSSAAA